MKFLDEYRDGDLAQQIAREIHRITTRPWNIMEVCGGQTHAIVRHGIDQLLPPEIERSRCAMEPENAGGSRIAIAQPLAPKPPEGRGG